MDSTTHPYTAQSACAEKLFEQANKIQAQAKIVPAAAVTF